MTKLNLLILNLKYIFSIYLLILALLNISSAMSDEENEVLIKAGKITTINNGEKIIATENIIIETNEFISTSDKSIYIKDLDQIETIGNISVKDKLNNHYYFDKFTTDTGFANAIGSNVKIRMNDGVRIVGKSFTRHKSNINQINSAAYTPCLKENYIIKNCPGWRLDSNKVIHDEKKQTVYYEGAVLKILNIPILYSPFFSHPDPTVKKKSGFLMPKFSSDNVLGSKLSLPIFYNLASNYDLTFTPSFQSKADDYYTIDYRHITKNHSVNIQSSLSNNESNNGTKNHFFLYGAVKNPFGKFNYNIETSNNDTYLRKNQINDLTIFTSGLNFTKEMDNSYLDFNTHIYKHLNNPSNQKWEYVYPTINYDLYDFEDKITGLNWEIKNSLLNYRDIDKNYNQQISSEILSNNILISQNTGLKFENVIQNRMIYFNDSANNFNQLRIFPQLSSKVSFPLRKNKKNRSELLEPIIMPIIAPYNNYNNDQGISSSNTFSLNRETSLSQWESGPRINYGINWLINFENLTINSSIAQVAKVHKDGKPNNSKEISNYFISNTMDLGDIGYIKNDITLDRKNLHLKDNNINTSLDLGKIKFGFDYDYETSNKVKTSEQISIGTKINFKKDMDFIASLRKDLMTQKSIGNAFGIHYENDCLAINFDYFRDFTAVDDIKNASGFSFTVTLKPFGTSKQRGKVRNFGPEL